MRGKLLIFTMFLLIYSPKIAGTLDTLSMVSIIVFVLSLLTGTVTKIAQVILRSYIKWIWFLIVMLVYSLILYSVNSLSDTYQILRFGRCIVNLLGILGLVSFYYQAYSTKFVQKLIYHLWLCIMAHAVLMLIMFFSPSVNSFVVNQLIQLDVMARGYDVRIEARRIGGLTSSFDATSGVQSLGILFLPFIYQITKSRYRYVIITISVLFSLFAIFISGLTGFVVLTVVGLPVLLFHFFRNGSKLIKYVPAFSAIIVLILLIFNFIILQDEDMFKNNSIGRTLYMVTQNADYYSEAKYSSTAGSTIERITRTMYFLPDRESELLFGRGGSGRSSDYRVRADPGIILNIHNLGIIFVIFLYSYIVVTSFSSYRLMRSDYYLGLCLLSIFLVLLIIDLKVQYLLARQSFSIMLIALACLWYSSRKLKRTSFSKG